MTLTFILYVIMVFIIGGNLMQKALLNYNGFYGNKVYINTSVINIAKNLFHHSRTKHIHIRHHFLCDNVELGLISMGHVRTEDQVADIFTKALDKRPFEHLRLLLGMITFK